MTTIQNSLRLKLTLAAAAIFCIGVILLGLFAGYRLYDGMTSQQEDQYRSQAELVAAQINDRLRERLNALEVAAAGLEPALMDDPAALQRLLAARPILQSLFNRGSYLLNKEGRAIASLPTWTNRVGVNFSDRDYAKAALQEGRSVIAQAVVGRVSGSPTLVMAVPIRNRGGDIIGAWAGATDLTKLSFLDALSRSLLGRTGGYQLISPDGRQLVTYSQQSPIARMLPATGESPALDALLAARLNTTDYIGDDGDHMIAVAALVPINNWIVIAKMPTDEAFEPIFSILQKTWLGLGLFLLITTTLLVWVVRRLMAPLTAATAAIAAYQAGGQLPNLNVRRNDEIGQLALSFNNMAASFNQQQRSLVQSECKARGIIETTLIPMVAIEDGKFQFLNPAFTRLLGYELVDLPNLAAWFLLAYPDPQDRLVRESTWSRVAAAAEHKRQFYSSEEVMIRCKDGNDRTFIVSVVQLDAPNLDSFLVSFFDVTELRAANERIAASEMQLRRVMESDMLGLLFWSAKGEITQANDKFLATVGYTRDDLAAGRIDWSAMTPPEYAEIEQRGVQEIVARGACTPFEKELIRKDGSRVPIEIGAALLPGQPRNGVAFVIDITARRQAERDAKTADALSSTVINSLTESLAVIDANGNIINVNLAWRRFGRPSGEIAQASDFVGTNYLQVCEQAMNGDDRDSALATLNGIKGVLAGHASEFQLEYPCDTSDGKKWFRALVVPLRGERTGAVITHKDITKRKVAEFERIALEEQLREAQKMEAIGTLAGGIAHDFNNILASVLGNTALAKEDAGDNQLVHASLDEIQKAGARARDLVQQILSFSRRQPTSLKPILLVGVIEESVRLLRSTLPPRIRIESHIGKCLPAVLADATQIEQVVINLCTNAAQAMAARNGHIQIRLAEVKLDDAFARRNENASLADLCLERPGRGLMLTVEDDASGMDAATCARIFEPFFTTKPVGEGTGLGLSVVHGIVKAHHGVVWVNSAIGYGTTFNIVLPSALPGEANAAEHNSVLAPTGSSTGQVGRAILGEVLYLDDDEALVYLVSRALERRGMKVAAFTDQEEAIFAVKQNPGRFAAVITDYNMPRLSGVDVVKAVKALRNDLPAAIASGYVDDRLLELADEVGADQVLFKASDMQDYCDAIEKMARAPAK
jgi:PAS domain S-box-containing protein